MKRYASVSPPTLTPGIAGRQVAGGGAVVGSVLPQGAPWPRVRTWVETCSCYSHPPADRQLLVQLLCALRPGDAVLLPCLSRLARLWDEQQAILAAIANRGAAVLLLAVGRFPAAPMAVLAVPSS